MANEDEDTNVENAETDVQNVEMIGGGSQPAHRAPPPKPKKVPSTLGHLGGRAGNILGAALDNAQPQPDEGEAVVGISDTPSDDEKDAVR